MTNYNQCALFYSWGIDLAPYVPVMITPDQYKQITGSDYVASKKLAAIFVEGSESDANITIDSTSDSTSASSR